MALRTTQESWNVLAGTEGVDEQEALDTLASVGSLAENATAAVAAKTEIAALDSESTAAEIVAALQA